VLRRAQALFLSRPKKKGAAADAPKVYLFKCLAGADSAKGLFDVLKPLTRKGDDTPLRTSALVDEQAARIQVRAEHSRLDLRQRRVHLAQAHSFITHAKERLELTICAVVAFRAVAEISSSILAEGGMLHVTNMGAANRMSMLDRSFLNEVLLRENRTMVGAVLIPLALERIRRTAASAQVPLFA